MGEQLLSAFWKALKNPLTIASLLSLVPALLAVDLPTVLDNTVGDLADLTTGLALMMPGVYLLKAFALFLMPLACSAVRRPKNFLQTI